MSDRKEMKEREEAASPQTPPPPPPQQQPQQSQQPIPPTFNPGPKLSRDGRTIFHKDPTRERFDAQWRAAVQRGEDPTQNLQRTVDAQGSSSFIEYWWRKARGKERTRAKEKEAGERRRRERVEGGVEGLLVEDEDGDGDEEEEREERGGRGGRTEREEAAAGGGGGGGKKITGAAKGIRADSMI